jgi:hypothetical protein
MRNFLYNKSDIIVALSIIVVAGLIIWSRVDAIMAYPSGVDTELLPNNQTGQQEDDTQTPSDNEGAGTDNGDSSDQNTGAQGTSGTDTAVENGTGNGDTPSTATEPVQFTITLGQTTSVIAENLFNAGLVSSEEAFLSEVTAQGAEKRMRAGTFTIPAKATVQEIVRILAG